MKLGRKTDRTRDGGTRTAASARASARFRWTISRKIVALGLAGLCVAVAAMLIQRAAIGSLATASERTATAAAAVRAGTQASAELDALRGDVFLAMVASDRGEAKAAQMTLQADGRAMLDA